MKRAYQALFRPAVLWLVLLGAMAGVAGTSAVVLASGPQSPQICFGTCVVGSDCDSPLYCNCNDNNQCYRSQ